MHVSCAFGAVKEGNPMNAMTGVKRAQCVVIALIAALAVVCAVCLSPAVGQAQAADSLSASYSTKAGSFKTVKMGATAGSAKSSAKELLAIKIAKKSKLSGSVSYTLYCGSKKYSASNGKAAGKKYKANAMTVKLSKNLAKKYNVYYRVYIKGYGWLSWTKNGAKAGTSYKSKYISAYQVKLVKKTATPPTAYANGSYVDSKFFGLTGDLKADAKIVTTAKAQKSLPDCLLWVANNVRQGKGNVGNLSSSNLKKAAIQAFDSKYGDCFNFTAAFYYLAKYKGAKVKAVVGEKALYAETSSVTAVNGTVTWNDGTVTNCYPESELGTYEDADFKKSVWTWNGKPLTRFATYSWCEVTSGGQQIIYDPLYQNGCQTAKIASDKFKSYGFTVADSGLSHRGTGVYPQTHWYRY